MPIFALFFSVPIAIAATALVHFFNNIFKCILVGRYADRNVVVRFSLPAAAAAFAGAGTLFFFDQLPSIFSYELGGTIREINWLKTLVGTLVIGLALLQLLPRYANITFDQRHLTIGGLLSGFFGGLSGHQGELRSAFLAKMNLSKEAFIGTNVISAVIVDAARLLVYGTALFFAADVKFGDEQLQLVAAATFAAFLGAFIGARLMEKVTLRFVRRIVGILMIVIGVGLVTGLL
jgi:uncharacterized membrane protein YfcA